MDQFNPNMTTNPFRKDVDKPPNPNPYIPPVVDAVQRQSKILKSQLEDQNPAVCQSSFGTDKNVPKAKNKDPNLDLGTGMLPHIDVTNQQNDNPNSASGDGSKNASTPTSKDGSQTKKKDGKEDEEEEKEEEVLPAVMNSHIASTQFGMLVQNMMIKVAGNAIARVRTCVVNETRVWDEIDDKLGLQFDGHCYQPRPPKPQFWMPTGKEGSEPTPTSSNETIFGTLNVSNLTLPTTNDPPIEPSETISETINGRRKGGIPKAKAKTAKGRGKYLPPPAPQNPIESIPPINPADPPIAWDLWITNEHVHSSSSSDDELNTMKSKAYMDEYLRKKEIRKNERRERERIANAHKRKEDKKLIKKWPLNVSDGGSNPLYAPAITPDGRLIPSFDPSLLNISNPTKESFFFLVWGPQPYLSEVYNQRSHIPSMGRYLVLPAIQTRPDGTKWNLEGAMNQRLKHMQAADPSRMYPTTFDRLLVNPIPDMVILLAPWVTEELFETSQKTEFIIYNFAANVAKHNWNVIMFYEDEEKFLASLSSKALTRLRLVRHNIVVNTLVNDTHQLLEIMKRVNEYILTSVAYLTRQNCETAAIEHIDQSVDIQWLLSEGESVAIFQFFANYFQRFIGIITSRLLQEEMIPTASFSVIEDRINASLYQLLTQIDEVRFSRIGLSLQSSIVLGQDICVTEADLNLERFIKLVSASPHLINDRYRTEPAPEELPIQIRTCIAKLRVLFLNLRSERDMNVGGTLAESPYPDSAYDSARSSARKVMKSGLEAISQSPSLSAFSSSYNMSIQDRKEERNIECAPLVKQALNPRKRGLPDDELLNIDSIINASNRQLSVAQRIAIYRMRYVSVLEAAILAAFCARDRPGKGMELRHLVEYCQPKHFAGARSHLHKVRWTRAAIEMTILNLLQTQLLEPTGHSGDPHVDINGAKISTPDNMSLSPFMYEIVSFKHRHLFEQLLPTITCGGAVPDWISTYDVAIL